jgi:hypothetical protein
MPPAKSPRKFTRSQSLFQDAGRVFTPDPYRLVDRLFIVSTGANKTDPEARKQIRSHVMMGKNCKRSRHDKPETLEVIGSMADASDQSAFAKRFPIVIPQKVGSDLTFTTFPDTIDRQAAFEAVKCELMQCHASPRTLLMQIQTPLVWRKPDTSWSLVLSSVQWVVSGASSCQSMHYSSSRLSLWRKLTLISGGAATVIIRVKNT